MRFSDGASLPAKQSRDYTGEKFGKLTTMASVGRAGSGHIVWGFRCDCGNYIETVPRHLIQSCKAGSTPSCGCTDNLEGALSRGWKGIESLTGRYISACRYNARDRGFSWKLTKEYLWSLYENQNKLCALSGKPIYFDKGTSQTASLDRIDSTQGYIEGNVQWVHKDINLIKLNLNQDYFIELCIAIADHNRNQS